MQINFLQKTVAHKEFLIYLVPGQRTEFSHHPGLDLPVIPPS